MTVVIATSILLAGATPAFAHTVAGTGATNYKSTLKATPTLAGLTVRIIENGSRLEASYDGDGEVIVEGYQSEPYLRITRTSVEENLKSPATYINRTRNGTDEPATTDAKAEPEWHKISSGHVARWHDHRIHWMGGQQPPAVRNAPDKKHVVVPDWVVKFRHGDDVEDAKGDLLWVPGPSPAPMLLLAGALVVVMAVVGRRAKPFIPVAIAAATLVVVDIVHSFGIGFANAGTTMEKIGRTFSASTVSIPAWIVGAGAVWFLTRRKVDGFFAAVFSGLIVAVVGGLADSTVLSRSQIPFGFAPGSARPIVAISLGLGVGVAVASAMAIRQLEPRLAKPKYEDD